MLTALLTVLPRRFPGYLAQATPSLQLLRRTATQAFGTCGVTGATAELFRTLLRPPLMGLTQRIFTTNRTYTANFNTQYYLAMTHGTGGTVNLASGWRGSGAAVSISATPTSGYSFTNWSGSGIGSYSGTNNPASITMSEPITETATFIHN